ncbi:MAG: glycerophosphodiester phosphodiesterase [Bryobacteraceae bacterium]
MTAFSASSVKVHGHRGARAVLPENTIAGFEYAIEAGADFVELDLAVTKDDVLVVSHDPVINAKICTGGKPGAVIREMTFEELQRYDCGSLRNPDFPRQKPVPGARIPSLDQVLELASRGDFVFNIETKISADKPQYTPTPEEYARMLLDAIRKHKIESRVRVQSFDFRTLHEMKKLAPEIPLAALYSGKPEDFAAIAREAGAGIAAPHLSLVTKARVDAAHAAGVPVVPWTANTPEEWDRLIEAGVDEIITDDPAGLIEHLKKRGVR